MRVPILLVCSTLVCAGVYAETLSDADRETLLDNLEKLRDASNSKKDSKFRLALAAYRSAIASDDSAMELYLNCTEKVNFEDLHKKPAEFRDWKTKEKEKLADPGFSLALRHQLQWLMLTLEAASEKPNVVKLASDAQEAIDSIFRDADKLKDQQEILSQAVTATIFARAYDIGQVKVESWPLSPIDVAGIYDDILLPPYRKPGTLAGLRAGWLKRIHQETVKVELWSKRRDPRGGGRGGERTDNKDDKIGMVADLQSPEYTRFLENDLPKLQWEMEVDLFHNGDEAGASVRMLAHLEKYINHPSARAWADEFQSLLKPKAPAPKPVADSAAP